MRRKYPDESKQVRTYFTDTKHPDHVFFEFTII